MDKRIVYGLVGAAVVIAGGAAYLTFGSSSPDLNAGSDTVMVEIKPTDHVRGSPNAPITIVEYAAMHCPFCAHFEGTVLPKLMEKYINTGKVKLVFRDFPLIGPDWLASGLTHCVAGDKFFFFVDLIFAGQDKWVGEPADTNHDGQLSQDEVTEALIQMGHFAGFDREKAESCINDKATQAELQQTETEAMSRYGVNSTPTFIIDGHVHTDITSWEKLDEILKPLTAR